MNSSVENPGSLVRVNPGDPRRRVRIPGDSREDWQACKPVLHTESEARGGKTEFAKSRGGEGIHDVLTFQKSRGGGGQDLT